MPFPIAAAIAGGTALYGVLKGRKKTSLPPAPNFFVNNPDELQALIRQSAQSQYGDYATRIRESLSNAGVLSPSSYSDALTKGSIALGQETLGKFSDIGLQELDRARAFESQRYLTGLESSLASDRATQASIYSSLEAIGTGLGDIFGNKEKSTDPLQRLLDTVKKKKTGKGKLAPGVTIG